MKFAFHSYFEVLHVPCNKIQQFVQNNKEIETFCYIRIYQAGYKLLISLWNIPVHDCNLIWKVPAYEWLTQSLLIVHH